MKQAFIVGIDPGWANLSHCVLALGNWRNPIKWTNERILSEKMTHEKLWQATYNWCRENEKILGEASMIVLEQQHEAPLQLMVCTIRTMFPHTAVVVNPMSVAAKYGLPRKRAEKKKATVELVAKNVRIPAAKKKDDLADSYLLAIWGYQKLEQSTEGWKN
jgi:hypothetical protein